MSNYAFTNCSVIDGIKFDIQEKMTILVSGGKITQIGRCPEIKIPAGYTILDISGKYVMPGLMNTHVHLFGSGKPMKAMRGGKAQKRLVSLLYTKIGQKILNSMVKDHALSALSSGVTTIRTVGDLLYSDVKVRDQGLTPAEAIHNATLGNAKILGIDHMTGTLEPGKVSDLIVLKRNPLADLSVLSDIDMVMREELLIDNPKVTKICKVEQLLDSIQ